MRPLFSGDGISKTPNQPTECKITGDVHKSVCRRQGYGFNARSSNLVLDSPLCGTIGHVVEYQWNL